MSSSRPARGRPRGCDPRRALGGRGEDAACAHLERLGFAILARNVRTRYGEIDVIAFDRRVLVFVEVKTLRERAGCRDHDGCAGSRASGHRADGTSNGGDGRAVDPLAGLRWRQRHRLRRLAAAWLVEAGAGVKAKEIRFDAIGVILDGGDRLSRLEHIEGAW